MGAWAGLAKAPKGAHVVHTSNSRSTKHAAHHHEQQHTVTQCTSQMRSRAHRGGGGGHSEDVSNEKRTDGTAVATRPGRRQAHHTGTPPPPGTAPLLHRNAQEYAPLRKRHISWGRQSAAWGAPPRLGLTANSAGACAVRLGQDRTLRTGPKLQVAL
jgi:hypothetical protein